MTSDRLPNWRETPAKQSIVDFVSAVTHPDSGWGRPGIPADWSGVHPSAAQPGT